MTHTVVGITKISALSYLFGVLAASDALLSHLKTVGNQYFRTLTIHKPYKNDKQPFNGI